MHFISFYFTIFSLGILHLIKLLYLEIITGLHAVVRNDEDRFCTLHTISPTDSILQNLQTIAQPRD